MGARSDKELISRLPRTFVPALNEQLRNWDLLFPAERRLLRAQLDWLAALPAREFQGLFAPIVEIESRMDLPRWRPDASVLTIEDTAILARSPLYPQWRAQVEKAFERIDAAVEASGALKQVPRLVVSVLPAGLPLSSQPLWPDLEDPAAWIGLEGPFGRMLDAFAGQIANRTLPGLEPIEGTWVLECGPSPASRWKGSAATVLSWAALANVRREFSTRLNTIRKSLKAADQANEELKRIDIKPLLGPDLARRPEIREFVRALLLSGNGGLVFNNSFVQWGAAEVLRRVQPQVLFACFGIRSKPKPFSSVVLLEDQGRSNPAPDEPDLAGSLTDGLMLAQYVHLAARRLQPYYGRTLTLLAIADLDRLVALCPKACPLQSGPSPVGAAELTAACLRWLEGA